MVLCYKRVLRLARCTPSRAHRAVVWRPGQPQEHRGKIKDSMLMMIQNKWFRDVPYWTGSRDHTRGMVRSTDWGPSDTDQARAVATNHRNTLGALPHAHEHGVAG